MRTGILKGTLLSILVIVLITAPLLMVDCSSGMSNDPSPTGIEHIVLIVIDGVNADVLRGLFLAGQTPSLKALADGGSYTFNAWTVWPSVTMSAVPSIYTGATPEVHKVTSWTGSIYAETLTEVFNGAGLTTAIFGESEIVCGYQAAYCDSSNPSSDPNDVYFTNQAITYLDQGNSPFFLALYNSVPDHEAHYSGGYDSDAYRKAIINADTQVELLVSKFISLGWYNNTLFVITPDHGMTGDTHSNGYDTDMRTWSIWCGPGVKSNYEMVNDVYIPPMSPGYAKVQIYAVDDDSWSEANVTWNHKPNIGTIPLDVKLVNATGWYSWDVTGFVSDQFNTDPSKLVSICMVDADEGLPPDHMATFDSREWTAARPYLEIQYQPPSGSSTKVYPSADSYVYQNEPDSNLGQFKDLYVGRYRDGGERAFLMFDIGSSIPAGSTITQAEYHCCCWRLPVGYAATDVAHRIIDIAPTITALAGLRAPANSEGSIIYQIMITTPHDPIYIASNADFTSANGVVGGHGVPGDPYIIQNWDIDASTANGIEIRNTTAHFVIRNCYVHGKEWCNYGIMLDHVQNGQIESVATMIGGYGIGLYNSEYNNIVNSILEWEDNGNICLINSTNNVISNCTFSIRPWSSGILINYSSSNTIESSTFEGGGTGIYFVGASNNYVMNNVFQDLDRGIYMDSSNNNHIYHNNFINNVIQASDGCSNYWDDGSSRGNYWSDYTGTDATGDGIGDTPYNIPGGTNQDRYPLMDKIKTFNPFTPIGSNVEVTPTPDISVTFTSVISSGITTVTASTSGPSQPTGYNIVGISGQPIYYDITTTASYSGPITICIAYDETQVSGPEANLALMHKVDGWVDITTWVDTVNNKIYGTTMTLSPFIVAGPTVPVGGIAFPADKLALLAPWIILAVLMAIAAVSVAVYWRKRQQMPHE